MFEVVKKTIIRKKILIITIALIIILLFAFKVIGDKKPSQDLQISNRVTVTVEQAKMTDSMAGLTYKANLEPREEATVSNNVSGLITQITFEDGDRVTQGQALAYLDDKDLQNQLKSEKINLNKLQLDLESAKSNYNIAKELYENGACSKVSFTDAERAYKTAQANVELKNVAIQDIINSLNDCIIKAPISGEIGDRNINLGQYVNPGTVMAKVKNNTSIKAVIQLMQDDLQKVTVGQEVNLKLSQKEETSYKGVVRTIAASANIQTRVFDCLVEIENADGMLNSGIFAYIEIPDDDKKQVLAIPMSAVTGSEGDYSVFTLDKNIARKISINIGEIENDMVEVTSGLREGTNIITTNLNSLQDGDKVTVREKVK